MAKLVEFIKEPDASNAAYFRDKSGNLSIAKPSRRIVVSAAIAAVMEARGEARIIEDRPEPEGLTEDQIIARMPGKERLAARRARLWP